MIPINELKIGNYIDEQGLYLQVGMIQQGLFDASEPIPLTDEILRDWCGVNRMGYLGFYRVQIDQDGICSFCASGGLVRYVRCLHQLQNLYFALTGEELIIKTPKQ